MIKLIPEYINEAEQNSLVRLLEIVSEDEYFSKRFGKQTHTKDIIEIPYVLSIFTDRLIHDNILPEYNSIVVNCYGEKFVLPFHKDGEANGKTITVLSLLSDATLCLKKDKDKENYFSVEIPKLSLYQLTDETRNYYHSVLSEYERISIVFLNVE